MRAVPISALPATTAALKTGVRPDKQRTAHQAGNDSYHGHDSREGDVRLRAAMRADRQPGNHGAKADPYGTSNDAVPTDEGQPSRLGLLVANTYHAMTVRECLQHRYRPTHKCLADTAAGDAAAGKGCLQASKPA